MFLYDTHHPIFLKRSKSDIIIPYRRESPPGTSVLRPTATGMYNDKHFSKRYLFLFPRSARDLLLYGKGSFSFRADACPAPEAKLRRPPTKCPCSPYTTKAREVCFPMRSKWPFQSWQYSFPYSELFPDSIPEPPSAMP